MDPVRHLDVEGVIGTHEQVMFAMGEKAAIINRGALEYCVDTAVDFAHGVASYRACVRKAAYYIWCLIINHPFLDGNKRTAFEVARVFLLANGYVLSRVSKEEVVSFLNSVAMGQISTTVLEEWIERHINPQ